MKTYKTESTRETKKIATSLVKKLLKKRAKRKNALVFALTGDLGSGKTTFIQGFLAALGIRKKITSPTFVLFKKYRILSPFGRSPAGRQFPNSPIYHVDCYRIKKPKELIDLGLKEILNNPQNIVLIEWAEKIRRILPKDIVWIKFKHSRKFSQRHIQII